mmetsp:Transcript_92559/g.135307  ORF Transcript_92559/g.135307 Transcript_92559/m.135307 type:complete len:365 (-) Transcript_92559:575-1669(-)
MNATNVVSQSLKHPGLCASCNRRRDLGCDARAHLLWHIHTCEITGRCLLVPTRSDDVIDLQNHFDHLGGEQHLLLLAVQRLKNLLLLHVARTHLFAIHTQPRVLLLDLSCLHLGQSLNARQTRVLSQRHGDGLERIGKRVHGILVHTQLFLGSLAHGERARDLGRAAAVDDAVVAHEVAHDTEGVVDGALDLFNDHLVGAAHEDGDGLTIVAVFDKEHAILGGSERHFPHSARSAKLVGRQLRETRHNTSATRNGKKLNLDAPNPAHGGKLVLHEQVVCLIVKAPLADGEGGASILDLLDHVDKVGLLLLIQRLVLLHSVDLDVVLGLGLGRLKGACQDADLGVLDLFDHTRVRNVFVEHDTAH